MPYAIIEKEFERLDDAQQLAVGYFVRFLLTQNGQHYHVAAMGGDEVKFPADVSILRTIKGGERKLGGFEKGFYMAPDFDEPLADFADYM